MTTKFTSDRFESIESYKENGFIVVKEVLDGEEIKGLRDFILDKVHSLGNPYMLGGDQILSCPQIYQIPFRKKVTETLKKIHGSELFYTKEFHIQYNMFGFPGWHMDCDSETPATYLLKPNYQFSKCGIYLQDNTPEWGGGIGVLPKAHKFPIKTGIAKIDFFFKKLLTKIFRNIKRLDVDIKAGDMVIFDSRLPHCSTLPSVLGNLTFSTDSPTILGIPDEFSKLAIYWNSGSLQACDNYMKHSIQRAQKELNEVELRLNNRKDCPEDFLQYKIATISMLKRHYPDEFPKELVELANSSSIKIACPSKEECAKWKALNQKYIRNQDNT